MQEEEFKEIERGIEMGRTLKPNEPTVISEPMDKELVVINLESGCYYNLNASAAKIWTDLARGATVEAVIESQQANGTDKEEISRTIDAFCHFLQDENLLIASEPAAVETECGPSDYEKPEIEKFTDMQEMLLLDPIHEVTEMGWPNEAEKP
jgi:hypothetical protein